VKLSEKKKAWLLMLGPATVLYLSLLAVVPKFVIGLTVIILAIVTVFAVAICFAEGMDRLKRLNRK
jgi:hypothetical protein